MVKNTVNLDSVERWLSNSLFNTDSPSGYFETVVAGIDPMWSLQTAMARVERIYRETDSAITLTLSPNQRFTPFQAGQHVQLSVDINGVRKTRTFSISSCPGEWRRDGTIQLTIKAIRNGQVTQWIHQHLKPGHVVRLHEPSGDFVLPAQANQTSSLYIAGGSGITPVMSHIRELLEQKMPYPISLLYYARHPDDFIFKKELLAIAKRFPQFKLYLICTQVSSDSKLQGHITTEHIQRAVKSTPAQVYLCGPEALKTSARGLLSASFGDEPQVYEESFGLSIKPTESADQQAQPVVLSKSHQTIECNSSTSLLEAAEQHGLSPNYGCRMGICYTCKCKKKSGVVRNVKTGQLSGTDEEDIQLCVSVPETPVEIEL